MGTEIKLIRRGWVNVTQSDVSVWVRGQAHLGDEYLNTAALAERFANVLAKGRSEIADQFAKELNGCWVVVGCFSSDGVYIAVDHSRSYQVCYSLNADSFVVSDDIRVFVEPSGPHLSESALHQYLSSCVVWRNKTIFEGVFSIQAGERICFENEHLSSTRLMQIQPSLESPRPTKSLVQRVDATFKTAVKRLVESVGDRRIVVPLSGGYDSRLVVSYLHKIGFKNVLCYSYGTVGNTESRISRCVAEALGYDWEFIEYGQGLLRLDPTVLKYLAFAANGCGTPFIQEYEAIRQLTNNGILHETDVIVPGHCFDVYSGSQLRSSCFGWNVASEIVGGTCCLFMPKNDYSRCLSDVKAYIGSVGMKRNPLAFELFSFDENISKAIYNSLRNYEWFGFEWRMPLTDRDIFNLWLSLGWSLRKHRRYFKSIANLLYEPEICNIPFADELQQSRRGVTNFFKKYVWEYVPYCWRRIFYYSYRQARNAESYLWTIEDVKAIVAEVERLIDIDSVTKRITDNVLAGSAGLRPLLVILSIKETLKNNGVNFNSSTAKEINDENEQC